MSKKCPWCNSENNHQFLKLKDYFLTQEEFEIIECDNCKLLFTNPCPTPDKIGDYYKSKDYLSHNEEKKGLFARIYNSVKKINIKNKFDISVNRQQTTDNSPKLLDIGCGIGDFLLYAKENGCVWLDGSEINPNKDNCGYHMGIRKDLTMGFVSCLCWHMNQSNKPKKLIFKEILGVNYEENYNK